MCGSCKKESVAEPAPVLEGRWEFRSTVTYNYNATNQLLSKSEQFPGQYGAFYLVLTTDSLKYFKSYDNSPLGAYKISRNGNEIQIPKLQRTPIITELTNHSLSLRFQKTFVIGSTGAYEDLEDNYVR
ncbi:hypothetical protein GCM10022409_04750 [Hymenobacter glaciei]|uniref:Lipocalin-like domain-containing protein n=1 Tax=Hymenobacter glaciei TaxID=877209 RepID=A0ABP7TBN3_9BACT